MSDDRTRASHVGLVAALRDEFGPAALEAMRIQLLSHRHNPSSLGTLVQAVHDAADVTFVSDTAVTPLTQDVVLCRVALIDIAETGRRLYGSAEKLSEVYGYPAPEHDYRLHLTTQDGAECTFHRGATADHIAADLARRDAEPKPRAVITA